jgi:threonine dehydrogenase-like Zn-dependent dehydrogenase
MTDGRLNQGHSNDARSTASRTAVPRAAHRVVVVGAGVGGLVSALLLVAAYAATPQLFRKMARAIRLMAAMQLVPEDLARLREAIENQPLGTPPLAGMA